MLFCLIACLSPDIPTGVFWLEETLVGELKLQPGWIADTLCARISATTFRTDGCVESSIVVDQNGASWITSPVQTALGEVSLRYRVQGKEILFPLGARENEHTRSGLFTKEQDFAPEVWTKFSAQFVQNTKAWERGQFGLFREEVLVGVIEFHGNLSPMLSVFDQYWLTPDPVSAELMTDGPDLVLQFPIEPSFVDELGLLRVNVLTNVATIPSDNAPKPIDLQLALKSYVPTAERLGERKREAINDSIEREKKWINRNISSLKPQISSDCELRDLAPRWHGYRLHVSVIDGDCTVKISPEVVQHRRRFVGQFSVEAL